MPKTKKAKFPFPSLVVVRILIVVGLIVFDYFLLNQLISSNQIQFSQTMVNLLEKVGVELPQSVSQSPLVRPEFNLSAQEILNQENNLRPAENALELDPDLTHVARLLAQAFQADEYQVEQINYQQVLENILKEVDYPYQTASEVALIGPIQTERVLEIWLDDEGTANQIKDLSFTKTGIYTSRAQIDGYDSGVVVQIFVEPRTKTTPKTSTVSTYQRSAREVPDNEVIQALNDYRAGHSIHPLQIDNRLCDYAQKRVQDLIAFGGLDHHQGFREDFADSNNYPPSLVDYPGRGFGENLASQFCINGTTKESFVAETGTALIEWCFDSSTSGHREAQLNPSYNSVCTRHGNNMYVIIFGE